jgi:hypothetical protein
MVTVDIQGVKDTQKGRVIKMSLISPALSVIFNSDKIKRFISDYFDVIYRYINSEKALKIKIKIRKKIKNFF